MNGADRAAGRRSRTPSAQVASELLNAAERVLIKDGMRGLTVRAVAAEAGVAPMSVYNQFGGKAGLLAALPLRGLGRLKAAIEAGEERGHDCVTAVCGTASSRSPTRSFMPSCSRGFPPVSASQPGAESALAAAWPCLPATWNWRPRQA